MSFFSFFVCCLCLIIIYSTKYQSNHYKATELVMLGLCWTARDMAAFDLIVIFFYVWFQKQHLSNSFWLFQYSGYCVVMKSFFEKCEFHVQMTLPTCACVLWKQHKLISNCSLIPMKCVFDTGFMFRCFRTAGVYIFTIFTKSSFPAADHISENSSFIIHSAEMHCRPLFKTFLVVSLVPISLFLMHSGSISILPICLVDFNFFKLSCVHTAMGFFFTGISLARTNQWFPWKIWPSWSCWSWKRSRQK